MSDSEKMFALAEQLKTLKEQKRATEEELREINDKIDETEYHLSELMAETETQNFTRAGVMFYLTSTTRASAAAGRREELYLALKKRGFGDLIYETVNANSLSAFVREQIAENNGELPTWLSGLVNVFEQFSVGMRRAHK